MDEHAHPPPHNFTAKLHLFSQFPPNFLHKFCNQAVLLISVQSDYFFVQNVWGLEAEAGYEVYVFEGIEEVVAAAGVPVHIHFGEHSGK